MVTWTKDSYRTYSCKIGALTMSVRRLPDVTWIVWEVFGTHATPKYPHKDPNSAMRTAERFAAEILPQALSAPHGP